MLLFFTRQVKNTKILLDELSEPKLFDCKSCLLSLIKPSLNLKDLFTE